MTVEYAHEVATGRGFGNFTRLLLRWKGSIYKLVLPDLIVYMFMYSSISLLYRFVLKDNATWQIWFERLVKYCGDAGVIPVSFVLGFYVSQIVTRWWNLFMTIPWPDTLAACVAVGVHGHDDRGRLMRRTIMRYINLTFVMTMIMISPQAKARFPHHDYLVEAGIMMPHEQIIIAHLDQKTDHPKYWVPIIWAGAIATRARNEGRLQDDMTLVNIIQQLTKFRSMCGDLLGYDWVCIPIVYTQVVTLAVYVYFAAALLGKQFVEDEHELDLFIPGFLFLEFFFYMGWLKVAETMVNPFGEDDDDFEVNWLIDRNFAVSYMIVDEMHEEHPEMLRDQYWDEVIPEDLPYTEATVKFKIESPQGSATKSTTSFTLQHHDEKKAHGSLAGSLLSTDTRMRKSGATDLFVKQRHSILKPDRHDMAGSLLSTDTRMRKSGAGTDLFVKQRHSILKPDRHDMFSEVPGHNNEDPPKVEREKSYAYLMQRD